jgi:hypothetical protein
LFATRPISGTAQSFQISLSINVEKNADIVDRQLHNPLRVIPKNSTAADIAAELHDFRKNCTVEQNRIAAEASVGRNQDFGFGSAVLSHQNIESERPNKGLIGEHNQRGIGIAGYSRDANLQGSSHTLVVVVVQNHLCTMQVHLPPNQLR